MAENQNEPLSPKEASAEELPVHLQKLRAPMQVWERVFSLQRLYAKEKARVAELEIALDIAREQRDNHLRRALEDRGRAEAELAAVQEELKIARGDSAP